MLLRLALLVLLAPGSGLAAQICAPLAGEGEPVALAGVDGAGDPVLVDGRVLRLVGVAPRQDEQEDARFRAGIEAWRGRALMLALLGPADRWGRLPARLAAQEPGGEAAPAREVGAALIASGAARRMAEPGFPACGDARPGSASIATASPRPAPGPKTASAPSDSVDGHDIAALKVQAGRFVALTGRIASVGERAQRAYLNLSRRRGEAASIVMSRRLWRELQEAGWTAARLNGRAVRADGVLSGRDGLLLELTAVSALNVID